MMNDDTNEILNINSNIKNNLNNVKNDNDKNDNDKNDNDKNDNDKNDNNLKSNKNNIINLEPFINNNELNENIKTYKIIIKNNLCEHKWVNDLIDIDPDRSQYICYCCKCELTK